MTEYYSFFEPFCGEYSETLEHLQIVVEKVSPFLYIDLGKVFRDRLRFEQSHDNLGIQLVDVLTNAVRRAMNGNLQPSGWQDIGRLTVQAAKDDHVIRFLDLSSIDRKIFQGSRASYMKVIPYFER